jgi:hypothetical protein
VHKSALLLLVVGLLASAAAAALPGQAQEQVTFILPRTPMIADSDAVKPVPRLPDGRVDLTGPWVGGGPIGDIEREGGLGPGTLPLLPWAQNLRDFRKPEDEPYTRCLPMSVPRQNIYPWKFAMSYTTRGLTHIYVLHELGDAGAHRVVYMDGRGHPAEPVPTWWGHSVGWFEGDTLVIDTVGYNDRFWFDRRGTPHTEQLHTIERFWRKDMGHMEIKVTVDDPGAYSRQFTLTFNSRLSNPGDELMEYVCQENNQYGIAGGHVNQFTQPEK